MAAETEPQDRQELFNYNRKFKEQLLNIKIKLENLQTEFGCTPNFLLLLEDNVTEKVNLRGRDSLTAGRILCCAEGSLKTQFALGEISFHPDKMSFVRKGNCTQPDPDFLHYWAESLRQQGRKRKHSETEENKENGETGGVRCQLLEPKVELLEPKVELTEEGEDGEENEECSEKTSDEKDLVAAVKEEGGVKQEPEESDHSEVAEQETIFPHLIKNETVKINLDDILLSNNPDKRFNSIDPQLVRNASDARKRDYSVQELVAQVAGGSNFSCGFCDFKTFCSRRLAVHVRSIHGYGAKKIVCRECGYVSTIKATMSQHMKTHKRDLIKCNVDWCSFYTFDPKKSLEHAEQHRNHETTGPVHVRSIHGYGAKKLVCRECGYGTTIKANMSQHMKTHKNDLINVSKSTYQCNKDWCSFYTFDPKKSLEHAKKHYRPTGVSPPPQSPSPAQDFRLQFQCPLCPFKSSSKKGIKVHENRIHGGKEKPVLAFSPPVIE